MMDTFNEYDELMAEIVKKITGEEDCEDSDPGEALVQVVLIRGSNTSPQMSLQLQVLELQTSVLKQCQWWLFNSGKNWR